MRGVALLVGSALAVGLLITSTAAAAVPIDDTAQPLDADVEDSQRTLELLLPGPVRSTTNAALDVSLPGDHQRLTPDLSLVEAHVAVAELSTTSSTLLSEDVAPVHDRPSILEGASQAHGTLAPTTGGSGHVAELPAYVGGGTADAGADGDGAAATQSQAQRSSDASSSVAEAWNELDGKEKAAAAGALGLLLLGPLTLYSRIQRDDALKNDTRREVYEIVEDNPGVCIQEVADDADVSYSTASYHLKRLVRMDYVTRREDGNKVLYYKNGGTFTPEEQDLIPVLQNEEAMRVFRHIVENPWCYRAQVAEALDVSHTTVNWHLDRLQDADLVEEHREGRSCHLNVNEESLDRVTATMEKLESVGATEQVARPVAAPA